MGDGQLSIEHERRALQNIVLPASLKPLPSANAFFMSSPTAPTFYVRGDSHPLSLHVNRIFKFSIET